MSMPYPSDPTPPPVDHGGYFLPAPTKEERDMAGFAHLSVLAGFLGVPSFVGPLVIWVWKKDESPFVAYHALQALLFQVVVTIALTVLGVAAFLLLFVFVGMLLIPVIVILAFASLIWSIVAGIQVMQGGDPRYPIAGELARSWGNYSG